MSSEAVVEEEVSSPFAVSGGLDSFSPAPLAGCNCSACAGAGGFTPQGGAIGAGASDAQSAALLPTSSAAAALMSGSDWAVAAGATVITFSFATSAAGYTADADFASTLMAFSEADMAMTRSVLATISDVCNVRFVEVEDTGAAHGQVRYAYSQMPNMLGYAGFAFYPGTPGSGGDVWLGKTMSDAAWDAYRPYLLLHETLHAVGLKHPFDGNVKLDAGSDLIANTVMSYSTIAGSRSGSLDAYPVQPMALDIAALQAMYGAAEHNAGDTVYELASAHYQTSFQAVWDSGGFDIFDASGIGHGVTLDLREGGRCDIGAEIGAKAYFGTGAARTAQSATYTQTLSIAGGTSIEAAIGTAYNDFFAAGSATQSISGGGGFDTAVFFGNVDDYFIDLTHGGYRVSNAQTQQVTALTGIERISFSDATLEQATLVPDTGNLHFEQAFRLYQAALDRTPDQSGLIYQTRALESGLSLTQLASNFIASPEFQQRYDVNTHAEFVTLLYANVLDRAPDGGGLAYHVGLLHDSVVTRADVLVGFSESPENQARVAPQLLGVSAEGLLIPV